MKKILLRAGLGLLVLLLTALLYAGYYAPGVMTGINAKVMCSCVFVTGRTPESVRSKELQVFPGLTLADITVNERDSSVTAKLLWRESKAIYRKRLGCTLLAEQSEETVRNQDIIRPQLKDPAALDSIDWPMGNRVSAERLPGVDYAGLEKAIDNAFADIDPDNPVNTHGIVILYDGELIGERYASGMNYNTRMMGWSMTKSIGNALIGILVRDGMLNIVDPAPVPEWQEDERASITVNHLLHASSGLRWSESYFVPSSDFHNMFIRKDDKAGFAATRDLEHEPGSVFEYSSGTSNLLSRIVRQTVGDEKYYRFPYERLFHRIGMHTALIEPDASGTFVASSYGFASARDWARFGLLYLNDGVFNGERILPEGWVKYSTSPAPAAVRREYGAQIWLNLGLPENPADCHEPGIPGDAFFFEGFEQNTVVVIPSRKLVAVRLGVTHNSNFSLSRFISDVIASIPGDGAVAARYD
jgi:CubicO group peptidase (beta-lactamase class C family)